MGLGDVLGGEEVFFFTEILGSFQRKESGKEETRNFLWQCAVEKHLAGGLMVIQHTGY